MKTHKDIGSEIKNKLDGFNKSPDIAVWERIEKQLKKKRRVLFFWYFSSSGVILALIVIGIYSFNLRNTHNINLNHPNNSTVNSKQNSASKNKLSKKQKTSDGIFNKKQLEVSSEFLDYKVKLADHQVVKTNTKSANSRTAQNSKNKTSKNKNHNPPKSKLDKLTQHRDKNNVSEKQFLKRLDSDKKKISERTDSKFIQEDVFEIKALKKTKDSILVSERRKKITKKNITIIKDSLEETVNKWSVNPQFIGLKYGAFNTKTTDNLSITYGILLGYKISEKIFARIGLRKLDLRQNRNNINYTISYLEFPVEVKYLLGKKNLYPFLTSGLSYIKLQDSSIQNEFELEYLETTMSVNLGVGIEQKIINQLYFNIETKFNYQLKVFSSKVDFNPYILSINTGIEYRF